MPKSVIEREIPGAGSLSSDQLHGIACFPANSVARVRAIIDPATAE